MKIKNAIFIIIATILLPVNVLGGDIYLNDGGAGLEDGTNCSNARDYVWFNNSSNWGGGGTDIDPGDTVRVCGDINVAAGSTVFSFQGSGFANSITTLFFEDNASITSSAFSLAIDLNGADYVTVDGGTNGRMQNTDNGSERAFQVSSTGIACGGTCDNVTVKNLSILDIYVRSIDTDILATGSGIFFRKGNNILFDNLTVTNALYGIDVSNVDSGTTISNIEIRNSDVSFTNFGIGVRNWSTAKIKDVRIHNNHVHDSSNWDNPGSNQYHHDLIYAFNSSMDSGSILGLKIYNNLIDGNNGVYATSWIGLGGGVQGVGSDQPMVYNNLLIDKYQNPTNGYIYGRDRDTGLDQNVLIANNTIDGVNGNYGVAFGLGHLAHGWHIINNIVKDVKYVIYQNSFKECRNNISFNSLGWAFQTADICSTGNGNQMVDPSLDSNYRPNSASSPAVNTGYNLIPLFFTDRSGNVRPQGNNWDKGSYEYTTSEPSPPNNLTILNQ